MSIGPLPSLLPEETYFSLCSRIHALWGLPSSGKTALALFGDGRTGMQHDLPSGLRQFERTTRCSYGDADELAKTRTLLRFFRPFLDQTEIDLASKAMGSSSVAHLKFSMC